MTRTILADIEGWTPIIDAVKDEVGFYGALVFGRMWRYCQMDDGVCSASIQKIASGLGIDRSTVIRQAQALVDAGFLRDLTPDEKRKPHRYADTGKAGLRASIVGVAQNEPTGRGDRAEKRVAQNDSGGVAQNDSKREDLKKDKTSKSLPSVAPPSVTAFRNAAHRFPPKAWYQKIAEVVGEDPTSLARWAELVTEWVGRGYNPGNVSGMLDAFKNGGLRSIQKHAEPKGFDAIRRRVANDQPGS